MYLIVATKVNIEANVTIFIGANDLVIVANDLTLGKGARIVGFEPADFDRTLPSSGSPGITSGNLYLIVTGDVSGTLDVELTGSHGENGKTGGRGRDTIELPTLDPGAPVVDGESQMIATGDSDFGEFLRRAKAQNLPDPVNPALTLDITRKIEACETARKCFVLACKRPASQAAKGKRGGSGLSGENGGDGGDNGTLFIRSQASAFTIADDHIRFLMTAEGLHLTSQGGAMGPGGRGGRGGPPPVQAGGTTLNICPKPNVGQDGEIGDDGPSGNPSHCSATAGLVGILTQYYQTSTCGISSADCWINFDIFIYNSHAEEYFITYFRYG